MSQDALMNELSDYNLKSNIPDLLKRIFKNKKNIFNSKLLVTVFMLRFYGSKYLKPGKIWPECLFK